MIVKAWLLNRVFKGENNVELTLFTYEEGLITAYWRTSRKNHFLAQPFVLLWIVLKSHNAWYYVQQIEHINQTLELTRSSLFAGLYLNELIMYAGAPADPDLFNLYADILNSLALYPDKFNLEILLRRFELGLLKFCGYAISFTQTASGHSISLGSSYLFQADTGFIESDHGNFNGGAILSLAKGDFSGEARQTAKLILRAAIDHFLNGRVLKSRQIFISFIRNSR